MPAKKNTKPASRAKKSKSQAHTPYDKYLKLAIDMGANHAVLIKASDVAVDPRVLLKCMYGCTGWNSNWTCPSAPNALKPWDFEKILRKYKTAILIHTHDKKTSQEISYQIEVNAFWDGFYLSWSMSDCTLCPQCSYPAEKCRFPKRSRPAMQGVGIDVYKTVRRLGLPLKPLKTQNDEQNWYSLVLIE